MARPPLFPPGQVFGLDPSNCAPVDPSSRVTYYADSVAYRASGYSEDVPIARTSPTGFNLWPIVAFQSRPLDRVSVWLDLVTQRSNGLLPPLIDLELRAGWGSQVTRVFARGTLTMASWDSIGLVFQASGLSATQFELWAGTRDGGVGRPAQKIVTLWTLLLVHSGCCEIAVVPGVGFVAT